MRRISRSLKHFQKLIPAKHYISILLTSGGIKNKIYQWDGKNFNNITSLDVSVYNKLHIPKGLISYSNKYIISRYTMAGYLWGWGRNQYGQLGFANGVGYYKTPQKISGQENILQITCANHSLILKADGTVWGTGYNVYGQIGDGTEENKSEFTQTLGIGGSGYLENVKAIACSTAGHSLAILADNTLAGWGRNYDGELGENGGAGEEHVPVLCNITDVISVQAGYNATIVLKSDGTVWAWGYNAYGQCGAGDTEAYKTLPVQVIKEDGTPLTNIKHIAVGGTCSFAITENGEVYCWGKNGYGELGLETLGTYTKAKLNPNINDVAKISSGWEHTFFLKNDGTLYACGHNYYGQLGDGTTQNRKTPVLIDIEGAVIDIAAGYHHSLAITT
ncbi:MAG: hypothetical protein LWW95_08365 [Candidatus Desulfofervidus auxilii]|nr:hypothetical protein [Candidatus Desulfofervidus auxilii]